MLSKSKNFLTIQMFRIFESLNLDRTNSESAVELCMIHWIARKFLVDSAERHVLKKIGRGPMVPSRLPVSTVARRLSAMPRPEKPRSGEPAKAESASMVGAGNEVHGTVWCTALVFRVPDNSRFL